MVKRIETQSRKLPRTADADVAAASGTSSRTRTPGRSVTGSAGPGRDATNVDLTKRMARSLKPGGYLSIIDYIRLDSPDEGGQVAWIMNFYFALTSQSGAFAFDDMNGWQRAAGLVPRKPARFRAIPGSGIQSARKPR